MKTLRLLLPCPEPLPGREWGDWFFARSLTEALERRGVAVSHGFTRPRSQVKGRRRRKIADRLARMPFLGSDLVLRGKVPFAPVAGRPLYIWLISWPETLTDAEIAAARHIFVASEPYAAKLRSRGVRCSCMQQCTDPALFNPGRSDPAVATPVLFVGNRRPKAPRPVVTAARNLGVELAVWGRHWEGELPPGTLRGPSIENRDLGRHYASAGVVLNDHSAGMRSHGFLNNRAFDVLASGRPIVTEDMPGLPDDLRPGLFLYDDGPAGGPSLAAAIAAARSADDTTLLELARTVAERHSFDRRVETMLEVMS